MITDDYKVDYYKQMHLPFLSSNIMGGLYFTVITNPHPPDPPYISKLNLKTFLNMYFIYLSLP